MQKMRIAMDLGSVNTKYSIFGGKKNSLFSRNTAGTESKEILTDVTCLAEAMYSSAYPFIVGNEAVRERPNNLIRPIRMGSVANTKLLSIYVKHLIINASKKRNLSQTEVNIALSRAIGEMKMNYFLRSLKFAGVKNIVVHDAHLMGAIGAGIDVTEPSAVMLVDIGAGKTGCAAIANGGIIWESVTEHGGDLFNKAITNFFKEKHGILISESASEKIKLAIGSSFFVIDGKSIDTGLSKTVRTEGDELRFAIEKSIEPIERAITDAIKALHPDSVSDLVDTGMVLIGGGAKLNGLPQLLSAKLHIPVRCADNPETAVVDGMRICAFENSEFARNLKTGYASA